MANQYLVSFLITQRGDQIGWIEDVIQSGLREGEYLETITITKLQEEGKPLAELFVEYGKKLLK